MQLPEKLKNVPLVVKMRDLFNMDEIPTLQAFSLTFHCDFLNLGVLTGKPILAALRSLQSDCRAGPGEVKGYVPVHVSPGCVSFLVDFILIYRVALCCFCIPALKPVRKPGTGLLFCSQIPLPLQRWTCLLDQSENALGWAFVKQTNKQTPPFPPHTQKPFLKVKGHTPVPWTQKLPRVAGQSTVAPGVHLRTRLKGFQGADRSPLFSDPSQRRPASALRGSPAVWQQPGRDMLFCLNPPHSLPFPHWPDGATLPAATAADVSCARSSRTHLPSPRHTAARRRLSGPGEVAANSRARTALGDPDSGEGTRAEGASFLPPARPPLAGASRGRRNPEPQPRRSRAAAAAEASLFSPSETLERLGDRP